MMFRIESGLSWKAVWECGLRNLNIGTFNIVLTWSPNKDLNIIVCTTDISDLKLILTQ